MKWFIDGQEVYSQTGSHIDNLVHAQKIMMNTWSSIYENWVGTFNVEDLPVYAFYDYSYYNYTPGYGDYGSGNNFTFRGQITLMTGTKVNGLKESYLLEIDVNSTHQTLYLKMGI